MKTPSPRKDWRRRFKVISGGILSSCFYILNLISPSINYLSLSPDTTAEHNSLELPSFYAGPCECSEVEPSLGPKVNFQEKDTDWTSLVRTELNLIKSSVYSVGRKKYAGEWMSRFEDS